MSVTLQDFKNIQPILVSGYVKTLYLGSKKVYELARNHFYEKIDSHSFAFGYGKVELYDIDGSLFILNNSNSTYTQVRKVKTIQSCTTTEFTGFEYNKTYQLQNGQTWQQTDSLDASSLSSTGNVIIFDDSILKVDNWEFYPTVIQIK